MSLGIRQKVKRFISFSGGYKSQQNVAPVRKKEWSIGIYEGGSPLSAQPISNMCNPVLSRTDISDVRAAYVADPFMIRVNDIWHMFFEVLNQEKNRGEIGLATSTNGLNWEYQRIVLAEPFHISYPYVFEWLGEYYMIPEAWRSGGVKLYKADKFPDEWSCIGSLIDGNRFADSSIFRHEDKWWLFTDSGVNFKSPVLRLYYSEDLMGPWIEHPVSPIIDNNPHIARPSGRIVSIGGRLIRFTQDVYPVYGSQVWSFEIQELSLTTYKERRIYREPILSNGNSRWNSGGMHHIDAHQLENGKWLACVDGFQWREQAITS